MGLDVRDQDTLIVAFLNKVSEGFVGYCEDMRLNFISTPTPICIDEVPAVDGQRTVRIDCNEKETGIRLFVVSG